VTDAADPGNAEARSAGQEGPSHDEGAPWGDVERARRASAEVRDPPSAELTSTEDARQTKKDRTRNRVLHGLRCDPAGAAEGQVAIADYVFYLYGEGNAWVIPPEAIAAWLGAAVIEVIGVVIVIVRFLFSHASSG
jgi:hypothetical protein